MKRKGQRDIPDFASTRPKLPARPGAAPVARSVAPTPAARPNVKPQATSAKSGRRGQ